MYIKTGDLYDLNEKPKKVEEKKKEEPQPEKKEEAPKPEAKPE